jgi:inosine-uridine nucleoside N-ribohydrolase
MRKILLVSSLVCVFLASDVSSSTLSASRRVEMLEPVKSHPVRMVLDTDTFNEIDDQFALVYSLISPELKVEAVYAAPFHNNRSNSPGDGMRRSYDEIIRILNMMDINPEGFAFKGSGDYLLDLKKPHRSPAALDLVARAKSATSEDPLYVVPVGAITNVASALLIEPSIAEKIVVVWLGGNGHNWPTQQEFNFRQDLMASRFVFDSGVPLVQLPCTPVVTHLATTLPEMEHYLRGEGETAEYLLSIFREYRRDHFAVSKVLWDMTAVAWLIEPDWLPSNLVQTPIVTDQFTFSMDQNRHLMRVVYFVKRDLIFRDFFTKLRNWN